MQTIYLDISNKGVVPTVYAKQGDVGRKFQVVLTDSGVPYIPANGSSFSVWYSGASGEGNYTDIGDKSAFSVNGNKVIVEMITQMLSNDGEGILSLVLNDIIGNQIGLWSIRYVCESVPGAESGGAKEYYTAFSESVKKLSDAETILKSKLSVDGSNAMEANLPMGGHRVTGLGEPVADGDAVPRGYANGHFAPAGYVSGEYTASNDEEFASIVSAVYGDMANNTSNFIKVVVNAGTFAGRWTVLLNRLERYNGSIVAWNYGDTIQAAVYGGVLQPFERHNPPMELGVEYRTTKRHNGKALYVIRVNVGALPNRASNGVPVTKTDGTNVTFTEIVEISGVAKSSGGNNPMGNQGGLSDVWIANESKMTVNMLTTDDLSSKTLEVTIWYTKD